MGNTNQIPTNWDTFKAAVVSDFIPEYHIRRARDRLRGLKHISSSSKYLYDFHNIVLTISDISDGEKWNKFCIGLKYDVPLEVRKTAVATFDDAAMIALRVDSALWSAHVPKANEGAGSSSDPTPMEIRNMEKRRRQNDAQRLADFRNNACFKCHKAGLQPWKHTEKKPVANNVAISTPPSEQTTEEHSSDSEN